MQIKMRMPMKLKMSVHTAGSDFALAPGDVLLVEIEPQVAPRRITLDGALRDIVIAGKGVATATTIHAATESLDEHSATVIAFVDQSVTNVTAPKGNQQRYRMVVTLAREGDRWLVSNVETL